MTTGSKAVPGRGDVVLPLGPGEGSLVLRPSFAAISRIEEVAGPVLLLVRRAAAGEVALATLVAVFDACRLPETPGDGAQIEAAITRMGVAEALRLYHRLLSVILKGAGDDQPGERLPASSDC